MNEIVFKKIPNHIFTILLVCSSVIGVLLVFYNPLNLPSTNKIKGLYFLPLLVFIWLWKNYFFLHKNYVRWNDKAIHLKINRKNIKVIAFEEISDISFEENEFLITLKNEKKEVINLKNITLQSKEKLKKILKTNQCPK